MTRKPAPRRTALLIPTPPPGLRERRRSDGSVRIWWEPSASARALGFASVELDAKRLTWSTREAEALNKELAEAQRKGKRAAPAVGGRSIESLIDNYLRSAKFLRRAEKTQRSYRAVFNLIREKWGQFPARDFTKPAMHQWYEALLEAQGAHTAISRLRHMSILMSHAELIGWRDEGTNPCQRLGMTVPKGRRRVAGWDELDALTAAAEAIGLPSIALAIRLSMFQGQRETDVMRARAGEFEHRRVQLFDWPEPREVWIWNLVRSKRGNEGSMMLHEEIAGSVAAAVAQATSRVRMRDQLLGQALRAAVAREPLLIDEITGTPYDEDRFQRRFIKVRAAAVAKAKEDGIAGLEDLGRLQFRDLRRTFGVRSRAGGASKDDTADVLGNSAAIDQQLADIYMAPTFETASRAVLALRRPTETTTNRERRKA